MGPTKRSCLSLYRTRRDTPPAAAAEETERQIETESSQRVRRPRGRPRRELSNDNDLGSSHSTRDHNVPLPTVDEDVVPQMYDDVVQHASEEGVPHTSEEGVPDVSAGAVGSTSSAASKPYKRGPSQLPKRPIPIDQRPLIAPDGDM
jgi:hypothetical protein